MSNDNTHNDDFKRASLEGRGKKIIHGNQPNEDAQPNTPLETEFSVENEEIDALFEMVDDLGLAPPQTSSNQEPAVVATLPEPDLDFLNYELDLFPTDDDDAGMSDHVPVSDDADIQTAPETSTFEALNVASNVGINDMPENDTPLEQFTATALKGDPMPPEIEVETPAEAFSVDIDIERVVDDVNFQSITVPDTESLHSAEDDSIEPATSQPLSMAEAVPFPESDTVPPVVSLQTLHGQQKPTAGIPVIPVEPETAPAEREPTITELEDVANVASEGIVSAPIVDEPEILSKEELDARAPSNVEAAPLENALITQRVEGHAAIEIDEPQASALPEAPYEPELFSPRKSLREEAPAPPPERAAPVTTPDPSPPLPPATEATPSPVAEINTMENAEAVEGIPIVEDIEQPATVDLRRKHRAESDEVRQLIPTRPELLSDTREFTAINEQEGLGGIVQLQPASVLAEALDSVPQPAGPPFNERRRPPVEHLFNETQAADPDLLEALVDDGRLYELWNMIEILQEEIAERPSLQAARADTYQKELLQASDMLLQSRENYDDSRAIVFRIRADLRRDDEITADIEQYNPLLMAYIIGWYIALVVLGLLSTGLSANFDGISAVVANAFAPALFGTAGGLFLAYTTLNRHVAILRDFDRAHVWWYFTTPFIGALMGFMTYLVWVATLVTTTAQTDNIEELLGFPPVVWVLAFVGGLQQNWVIGRLRAMNQGNTEENTARTDS